MLVFSIGIMDTQRPYTLCVSTHVILLVTLDTITIVQNTHTVLKLRYYP